MKAVAYTHYGPPEVLHLVEMEKPTPKDDDILIKVHAATVTSGDLRVRALNVPKGFGLMAKLMYGPSRPRQPILGTELSGHVESAGANVKQFKPGDQVFAFSGTKMGCYVEYKTMSANGLVAIKPAGLSFEEAAALSFGGTTALHFLKRGKIEKDEQVLINGASGGVGTAAVQLARYFGAQVTTVTSTKNLELMKLLGADHVIDYTSTDFTKNGATYDIIVDTAGTASFARVKGSLKEGARLLKVLGGLPDMLQAPLVQLATSKKVIVAPVTARPEDLRLLASLAEAGQFRPVIDRNYALEQIVEAHSYADTGHKKGNVVITVS